MKNIPTTLLLAIASLLGCGSKSSPPVPSGPRFLALGDSYTIGESVDPSERWPVQLARLLREQKIEIADPEIIATTGWTTDELSRGMDAANPRGPYALVSLLIGVNNQFRGRSVEEFREQFAALLTRAISLANNDASRVIVLSIPDWGVMPFAEGRDREKIGREIDQFNDVCREQCAKAKVRFIDITPISKCATTDSSLAAADGLHPSGKQYQLWAQAARDAAREALAKK